MLSALLCLHTVATYTVLYARLCVVKRCVGGSEALFSLFFHYIISAAQARTYNVCSAHVRIHICILPHFIHTFIIDDL